MSFSRDFIELWVFMRFYEFSSKAWVYENLLRLWVLRCDAYFHTLSLRVNYHHSLYDLWVMRWAIPMSWVWWVYEFMSYELLLLLCIVFWVFRGIVDIEPRVSLDGIREGLLHKVYWCSLTMYAKHRGPCNHYFS